MWMFIFLGGWVAHLGLSHAQVWAPNLVDGLLGVLLMVFWLFIFFWALHTNHQAARDVTKVTQLHTDGPYAHIRHPIYAADYLFGLSLVLLNPRWWMLVAVTWAWIIWTIWMLLEERGLLVQFGDQYRDYMKRVPRWWPKGVMKEK